MQSSNENQSQTTLNNNNNNNNKNNNAKSSSTELIYSKCSFYKPYASLARLTLHGPLNSDSLRLNHSSTIANEHIDSNAALLNDDIKSQISTLLSSDINNRSKDQKCVATKTDFNEVKRCESPVLLNSSLNISKIQTSKKSSSVSFASSVNVIQEFINSNINGRDLRKNERRKERSLIPEYLRKRSSAKINNLDHLLNVVGSFGLYQKIQFLLVGFLAIVPSMVAYSYVFVSATPRFTCSVVREIQLTTFDHQYQQQQVPWSTLKPGILERDFANAESNEDADYDDPFKYFKLKKLEYFIETRRFIRLYSDEELNNKSNIHFDNNCVLTQENILKKYHTTSMLAFPTSITTTTKGGSKLIAATLSGRKKIKKTNLKCVEWIYDESVYGRTTVTDMNLVCIKSHLKAFTQNAFILGTGCSVFTGILSDKYGRRTALYLLITLMVLVLNITQFLMHNEDLSINQKFVLFTLSRFFQGVAQTMYSIAFVLLLEITGPAQRVTAGNMLAYSFSIGQIIIDALAYYFRDWLKVQWCLALYMFPFFMYYWLLPESPRWLLSVGNVHRARHVLDKIIRVNNSYTSFSQRLRQVFYLCNKETLPKNNNRNQIDLKNDESKAYIHSLLQEEASKIAATNTKDAANSYIKTLKGILKSPVLMRRCFILFYTWMVILAVYLGIGMGISGNLDKYLNPYAVFLVAALFEFMSVVTCHLVLNRLGRKYPLICFMISSSLVIYLIPVYFERWPYVSICLYFLAKYSIGAAQTTCMIYTSELYPTPMRSTGVGLSVALARLGGVWAPQINVLSSTLGSIHVPFVIFSGLTLIAGLLCFTLPETLNKQLPSNVKEAKDLNKKSYST